MDRDLTFDIHQSADCDGAGGDAAQLAAYANSANGKANAAAIVADVPILHTRSCGCNLVSSIFGH
jgi:hypothetical protein